jgi:hypothetical protein
MEHGLTPQGKGEADTTKELESLVSARTCGRVRRAACPRARMQHI